MIGRIVQWRCRRMGSQGADMIRRAVLILVCAVLMAPAVAWAQDSQAFLADWVLTIEGRRGWWCQAQDEAVHDPGLGRLCFRVWRYNPTWRQRQC
jgi:hypothetical protein